VKINEPWRGLSGHSVATHNALAKVINCYTTSLWLEGWENNVCVCVCVRKSGTEKGNDHSHVIVTLMYSVFISN